MEVGVEVVEDKFSSYIAKTYMWMVVGLLIAGVTGIIMDI